MKNKYLIFGTTLFGMLSLSLTSCNNEKFLDVTQYEVVDQAASYESRENAKRALNGVYDMMFPNDSYDGDWGFKPNLFTGCHPTIDTQATGWDKNWNVQEWNANSSELLGGWKHVYAAICRANDFLDKLPGYPEDVIDESLKKDLEGEGRALRGFFYHWLATTFGRVPMLATGETFLNTPEKPRAATYTEMWDFIIEDFKAASELLDWEPLDGEYGRATKGMALAYLGDAYMWKAYRMTDGANGLQPHEGNKESADECYRLAADCFKQILEKGPYKLNESFTTLWDPASAWGPETIWCEQLDEGSNWGKWDNLTSKLMLKWYTACPDGNGGWGSLYLSWEWYSCYEKGDKRRDGSCYTGAVLEEAEAKALYEKYAKIYTKGSPDDTKEEAEKNAKYPNYYKNNPYFYAKHFDANAVPYNIVDKNSPVYGYNPYLQERLGPDATTVWTQDELDDYTKKMNDPKTSKDYPAERDPNKWFKAGDIKNMSSRTLQYHFNNGEYAPSIWSSKMWRTASAKYKSWGDGHWSPTPIYWKRLPNVMLDYAECLFRINGEDDATAWDMINKLRERAWGINEDGQESALTQKYLAYYNQFAAWVERGEKLTKDNNDPIVKTRTEYPIPFGSNGNKPEDAKTYYTKYTAEKGFKSPVWKVAVNTERRKEFNCEWSLRPDMQKSGFMADHVATNYPKRNTDASDEKVKVGEATEIKYAPLANCPWTNRNYEYNDQKMDMPIPQDELLKNPACDQNPGY